MSKKITQVFAIIGFLFVSAIVLTSFSDISLKNDSVEEEESHLPQMIKSAPMLSSASFAGEPMPQNVDTRERLDRELSVNAYWQSSTMLNIKMSNKYFPIIERILAEEGVPDDFKYLAVAESNLRNVVSSASAKGFWQFRKLAAKELGLEVNDEVDERYHIEKATRAAAGYLKKLHKRFGNWTDASAAYNMGPTAFARTRKAQGETSFYDLNLNSETQRYVFRLMAIKEIMKNPEAYGFYIDSNELYEGFDNVYNVEIDKTVASWADFADQHGVTYRMLKYYNPWLRDGKLTVINNKYLIKLPRR